jgi:predicted ATPase/DNA-binding SARP family transcriptional activator
VAMLDFRVLGTLEVVRGRDPVVITAAKHRTMLLVLLARPGHVVSATQLIDAVWPENPPTSARKLVQVYVSQLRSLLGPDAIETTSTGYRMHVAPDGLDAARFDHLRQTGRRALADGNAKLATALTMRALALWRGPALADVASEPFFAAEAARLDELRLDCLEDQIEAELALGHHVEVIAELQRLCTEHPLRERMRGRFAVALYRCGRQTEALDLLEATRRALLDEFGLAMSKELVELELAILNQDPCLDAPSIVEAETRAFPSPPSELIGRTEEVGQLSELLMRDGVRLVTITGAGGSGKTRVALEVARSAGSSFANGAAYVELASVQADDLVMGTIAKALGVPESSDESPSAALQRWLFGQDLLLVIDNFEHVISAAAELAALIQRAPRLTVLVTSRRVLHLSGERVFPLKPLPVDDAARLFTERASARNPTGDLTAEDAAVVQDICRRLDCLPLAIELAAARTSTLTPRLLLDRLTAHVAVLGVGPRDAPARQKTLADTLRWSTDLLTDDERRVLACLSTFNGGCAVEAAEAVAATDFETLTVLLDSSLLQRVVRGGRVRLTMLETVREHAARLFLSPTERAEAEANHALFSVQFAEAADLKGPGQAEGLATIDADIDNLRAACDRAESAGDDDTALRLATAVYRYWYLRGLFREGRDRITRPLERGAGDPLLQALALRAVAGLSFMLGELDRGEELAHRGVAIGTAVGALAPVMACHTVLSHIARERAAYADAQTHLERSEAIAEELGLTADVVIANTNLGELALATGDLDQARLRWEKTLEIQGAEDENSAFALLGLGAVAHRQGRLEEAADHFSRARDLCTRFGFLHNTTMALIGLAGVTADRGDHAAAVLLLGRASSLLSATGGELTSADDAVFQRARASAVARLGEDQVLDLLAAGASLTDEMAQPK